MQVPGTISLGGALLLLAAPSVARSIDDASPPGLAAAWSALPSEVLFDSPDGDTLQACGARYKASFEAGRMSYVPFLGSEAPRDFPLALTLVEVRVGDRGLDLDRDARPRRSEATVTYDRGSLREIYELELDSLEQSFRFEELTTGVWSPRYGRIVDVAGGQPVDAQSIQST